jgi:hypothetical protein
MFWRVELDAALDGIGQISVPAAHLAREALTESMRSAIGPAQQVGC